MRFNKKKRLKFDIDAYEYKKHTCWKPDVCGIADDWIELIHSEVKLPALATAESSNIQTEGTSPDK